MGPKDFPVGVLLGADVDTLLNENNLKKNPKTYNIISIVLQ